MHVTSSRAIREHIDGPNYCEGSDKCSLALQTKTPVFAKFGQRMNIMNIIILFPITK